LKESINFDRAAGFYDATRKLPDAAASAVTKALVSAIGESGAERVLEVGIGTGRIARPLMLEGVQMVGVDISSQMMGQLRAQLKPEHTAPDLLLGDATLLPVADDSFRAAVVVHVFHLVQSLQKTLAEIRRVLAPGGVLLHHTRRPTPETVRLWDSSREEWTRLLTARGYVRKTRREMAEIRADLLASGGNLDEIDVIESTETSTVEQEMERLRVRQGAWTWDIPSDIFDDALPEFEKWLRAFVPSGTWTDEVMLTIERWTWD
jgi:ubiquinone/menaquinone biosynthesis C-methylase UbiE